MLGEEGGMKRGIREKNGEREIISRSNEEQASH